MPINVTLDHHMSMMITNSLLRLDTNFCSAIPNGVVNSFSTVIIRDMGFSTTKTTELKSVGDAVQIVALLISGTIILNVPNCQYSPLPKSRV